MIPIRTLSLAISLLLTGAAGQALAGDILLRGPVPDWVRPTSTTGTSSANASEDGLRVLLFDTQFQVEDDRQSHYLRTKSVALSPQALPLLGSVGVVWSPASQDVTVHHVLIIRGEEVIDVLATQDFETLRREENLEQAMLDGQLTALLQPSGLRIGDVLDVAYSLVSRDPVTGQHAEHALDLNLPLAVDRLRYRASWPRAVPMRLRASNDWTPLQVRRDGDQSVLDINLEGLQPVVVPYDVPGRFRTVRGIELSDYRQWGAVAATLKPLYDDARTLTPGAPLNAEIARIRALSNDPAVQAAAALRLVQDQVRYVALLMGEGALIPASADETWARRFGDCKAKTALLLALLDGLGIKADPAAVSLLNGNGMNERLPLMSAFDHVLVRMQLEDDVYWLDGTGAGDRSLETVTVPPFYWALPLTGPTAELERLVATASAVADQETILAIDASAGLYAPASVLGTMVMRGEAASALGGQIGLLSADQRDQGLRPLWQALLNDASITQVRSNYDAETNMLTLTMVGTVPLTWAPEGLIPPGSTFVRMATEERPEGPFRDVPYAINHPASARQSTTLKLPDGAAGFRVSGGQLDVTELGHHIRRTVELKGDTVTIETAIRSVTDEITAAEAEMTRDDAAQRSSDPPRVFAATNYQPSDADRAAWSADTPTTSGGWLDRALALSQAGDTGSALAAAEQAVEVSPERSDVWANRGVYRFWTGDREGARADLEKAVDIDPSERVAMNGNALLAMSEGRHEDAVIELSRALRQVPGDDFALGMRSQAYIVLGQYDRALRDLDARLSARPDDRALKLQRVAFLSAAGRNDEADDGMRALVSAEPDDKVLLRNQAELELRHGRPQAALDILDQIIDASLDDPIPAHWLRAEASLALNKPDLVSRDFDAIRAAKPGDPVTLNNLCWLAAKSGQLLDQALLDCDAALAINPDEAYFYGSRGMVLLQRGEYREAVEAYEKALGISPELATSLYGRGLARIGLGQVAEGEADRASALELEPSAVQPFEAYERRE